MQVSAQEIEVSERTKVGDKMFSGDLTTLPCLDSKMR